MLGPMIYKVAGMLALTWLVVVGKEGEMGAVFNISLP
jgi:hypothetical protein